MHFLHHLGTVDLDGFRAEAQRIGYRLVGKALDDELEDLGFARGQGGEQGAQSCLLQVAVPPLRVAGDGALDAVEQVLVVEGLLDEVKGARLHGAHGHLHVAVAGDEYDRDVDALGRKALLQFKSAHAWHAHIQHQTARPRGVVTVDEGLRRAKILDPQAHRLDQPAKAARNGLVVINYEYCRLVHGDGIVVR